MGSLADAAFIPPYHEDLDLLTDLEAFWHNENILVPHLIRCALSHYQFETIHPFLDGNGRIGRLLITLYLVSHDLLHKPSLYLSAHLEKHRGAYYDALTRVRESSDIVHWVRFFLQAVAETAAARRHFSGSWHSGRSLMQKSSIFAERKMPSSLSCSLRHTDYHNKAMELLGIKYVPANSLIATLVDMDILEELTGFQRNRIFILRRYMDIFKDGN